ncbi:MAG TPA: HNH endonuclease [Kofleriaceae bacterium]
MSTRTHRLLLAAAKTDRTFEPMTLDGRAVLVGKCIHCNSRLVVAANGAALGAATVEHIVPQTRGGSDDVENLAVACARCNTEKGVRHDHKRGRRLDDVVALLQARRRERWREP